MKRVSLREYFELHFKHLSTEQVLVLEKNYGLNGNSPKSRSAIAREDLQLAKQSIDYIHNTAIKKIQYYAQKNKTSLFFLLMEVEKLLISQHQGFASLEAFKADVLGYFNLTAKEVNYLDLLFKTTFNLKINIARNKQSNRSWSVIRLKNISFLDIKETLNTFYYILRKHSICYITQEGLVKEELQALFPEKTYHYCLKCFDFLNFYKCKNGYFLHKNVAWGGDRGTRWYLADLFLNNIEKEWDYREIQFALTQNYGVSKSLTALVDCLSSNSLFLSVGYGIYKWNKKLTPVRDRTKLILDSILKNGPLEFRQIYSQFIVHRNLLEKSVKAILDQYYIQNEKGEYFLKY